MPWETDSNQELGDHDFPKLWDDPYNYPVYDLDGYNITLTPKDVLDLFGYFTSVQLCSHAPMVRDLEQYKDWVFIGSGPSLLKVHPRYKVPLLQELELDGYLVYPSEYPRCLIHGSQVISMYELWVCLVGAKVTDVRLQAYGMKTEVMGCLPRLGNPEHPLSPTNFFDVGRNFDQPHVTLVKLLNFHKGTGTSTQYPMLLNLGAGYGSVKLEVRFRGTLFKIKAYPRLVHCLKATSGKGTLFDPSSIQTCRRRETGFMKKVERLENFSERNLGGLRLEVTCQALTLQHAQEMVSCTPLLNLHEYIKPTKPEMEQFKLGVMFIKKKKYLSNFNKLLHKAQELGVFKGEGAKKVGPVRKNIIYDLGLALGWNPGMKNPLWHLRQPQWWNWVPSARDIDEPKQLQPTSNLKFKDPLSEEVHLQEIERCVKMYKRGTLWRAMIYNEGGSKVPFGSAQTKLKLAQLLWSRFKHDWTKSCYLEKHPFKDDAGTHQGTSQPPKKLDQDLDKYHILGTHMVPEGTSLAELQGTDTYRMTSGYIKGDGNCQFRVLSKIIYGVQSSHRKVRLEVVKYLELHPEMVEAILATKEVPRHPFLTSGEALTYRTYLAKMAMQGTWGDDATLSAAVSIYKLSLIIINPDRSYFEVNKVPKPAQWHALYYTGNHYELVLKYNPNA